MSHDATAWARKQKTGHGTTKLILLLLADFAGTDYSCYPSVAKLSEISELADSTVRSATKLLAELGLIRVFYRHRPDGSRRSSRYQLLIDGPETADPDAEDWANQRRIPAVDMRQESEDAPPADGGGPHRQTAVIPYKEPSPVEASPVVPGAARTARATRISEDYIPDEKMRAWFAGEGLHHVIDIKAEHARFVDYFLGCAGERGRKLDWPATWRNWMRRAADRGRGNSVTQYGGGTGPAPYRPSTTDQRVAQGLALVEKFRKMEEAGEV